MATRFAAAIVATLEGDEGNNSRMDGSYLHTGFASISLGDFDVRSRLHAAIQRAAAGAQEPAAAVERELFEVLCYRMQVGLRLLSKLG
eukprot:SAG11_NODE_136_length_15118_cov_14.188495_9_plen_88_part_00